MAIDDTAAMIVTERIEEVADCIEGMDERNANAAE